MVAPWCESSGSAWRAFHLSAWVCLMGLQQRVRELVLAGNIIRTAFTSNTAGQKGGAVFGETSTGNIMNSTFTTNKASQAGGAGGLRGSGCALSAVQQGLKMANNKIIMRDPILAANKHSTPSYSQLK